MKQTRYTTSGFMTPFNNIRSWQAVLSTAARQMQLLPRFLIPGNNSEHFLFDGFSLYLETLRNCLYAYMERLRDALVRVCAFGYALPRVDMSALTDDLSNHGLGYGIVMEPKNDLVQHEQYLLRFVLSNSELRNRFFIRVSRGRIIANFMECNRYLQDVGEVISMASACVLTCCGQPCRGTELSGFSPVNTEYGVRNIIVKDGRVFLFQLRQKAQSITGHTDVRDRLMICCFLDIS